jgi:hypothetical protein
MKYFKLYITVLSIFVCTNILAQKQPKFIIGGNAGINLFSEEYNNTISVSISPMFGYKLTKRVIIGVELYYSAAFAFRKGSFHNGFSELNIKPFAQLYLTKNAFLQPNVGIGFYRENDYWYNNRFLYAKNYTITTYGLGLGYDIYLTENFSITPILSYQHSYLNCTDNGSSGIDDSKTRDTFEARVGFVYRF